MEEATITYDRITWCVEYEFDKGERPCDDSQGSPPQVTAHAIWLESDPNKTDLSDQLADAVVDGIEERILELYHGN